MNIETLIIFALLAVIGWLSFKPRQILNKKVEASGTIHGIKQLGELIVLRALIKEVGMKEIPRKMATDGILIKKCEFWAEFIYDLRDDRFHLEHITESKCRVIIPPLRKRKVLKKSPEIFYKQAPSRLGVNIDIPKEEENEIHKALEEDAERQVDAVLYESAYLAEESMRVTLIRILKALGINDVEFQFLKEKNEPNKAVEPTPVAVTPPAEAGGAPSTSAAHLRR